MNNISKRIITIASVVYLTACGQATTDVKQPKSLSPVNQAELDNLAANLKVTYRLVSNIVEPCPGENVNSCYHGQLELAMPTDFNITNWQINFSQVYPTYFTKSSEFSLNHINGDIHQVAPLGSFSGFTANEKKVIDFWVQSSVMTESELMPNYFVTADNLQPVVIESTKTYIDPETGLEIMPYVAEFPTSAGGYRARSDAKNELATTSYLYNDNKQTSFQSSGVASAIVPTPKIVEVAEPLTMLDLSVGIKVSLKDVELTAVDAALKRLANLGVSQTENGVAVGLSIKKDNKKLSGSYELLINDNAISIVGTDETGVFYGLQSIASALNLPSLTLAKMKVQDEPRYEYRGQHIDVGRNFHNKTFMLSLIEQMASLKLNKLHLHLAEDEGWRLEIPDLPELTELASKRCMSLNDTVCLQPQLGGAGEPDRDGYYSVDDYIEIVRYANAHHIELIPSLDMPGHSRAAVKAMENRYEKFMLQENPVEAQRYLLSDLDDKTVYSSIQHYHDNTINVCMESSYQFFDKVITEIQEMHNKAGQPLKLYHIGADETAGAWINSPACQALVDNENNDIHDLKHIGANFIERVANILANKGLAVGGWNDGLGETQAAKMPNDVWSYLWGTLPGGGHKAASIHAANGWNLILATPDVFYFDFPYQVDPKERGYKWASRQTNTRDVFNFMPDNLPIHAEFKTDTANKAYEIDDRVQQDADGNVVHKPLPENYRVKGIQGQVWSETVRYKEQVEYMLYPRLFALAERAWHQAAWEVPYDYKGAVYNQQTGVFTEQLQQQRNSDWVSFSNVVGQKLLQKLDHDKLFYRIPTVGAVIEDGKLMANIAFPGLSIEFQQDDGTWQVYKEPVAVKGVVKVRARSTDGKRAGRSLIVQ